jgi:hypothetical protein
VWASGMSTVPLSGHYQQQMTSGPVIHNLSFLSNRNSKHKVRTDRVGLNQQDERNLRRPESVIGEGVIIFLSLNFSLKIGF